MISDVPVGRDPARHLVERVPKKEIARRLKLDVKTVRRSIAGRPPPVRVSPTRPGTLDPWRERIRQWLREEPRLTAKRIRRLAADGGTAPADGALVRGRPPRGRRPSCTAACCPARRWRSTSASRGSTSPACRARSPGGDAAVLQRVLRQGVPGRADRVAARRHRVGVPLLWGPRGPPRARQHLAGRQGRVGGPGPGADRGVRCVPGRVSVPGGVLRAGKGLGEGFCGGRCGVRNLVFRPRLAVESWDANAAIITELEADLPMRHLDDGRSVEQRWRRSGSTCGHACSPSRHLPRRRARPTSSDTSTWTA